MGGRPRAFTFAVRCRYTDCTAGQPPAAVPAEHMPWVDDAYHCWSVWGAVPENDDWFENDADKTKDRGWATGAQNKVTKTGLTRTCSWEELLEREAENKSSRLRELLPPSGDGLPADSLAAVRGGQRRADHAQGEPSSTASVDSDESSVSAPHESNRDDDK